MASEQVIELTKLDGLYFDKDSWELCFFADCPPLGEVTFGFTVERELDDLPGTEAAFRPLEDIWDELWPRLYAALLATYRGPYTHIDALPSDAYFRLAVPWQGEGDEWTISFEVPDQEGIHCVDFTSNGEITDSGSFY